MRLLCQLYQWVNFISHFVSLLYLFTAKKDTEAKAAGKFK